MGNNDFADIVKTLENSVMGSTIDYAFLGIVFLFSIIGFISGAKKGGILALGSLVGVLVAYFTYQSVGQLVFEKVQSAIPDLATYIESAENLGVNLTNIVSGVVAIPYVLVLALLGTLFIGMPIVLIFKRKWKLSMKGHKIKFKLLNRFLGLIVGFGFALIAGFTMIEPASDAIGLLGNPNDVFIHKTYVGEQDSSQNNGVKLREGLVLLGLVSGLDEEDKTVVTDLINDLQTNNGDATTIDKALENTGVVNVVERGLKVVNDALDNKDVTIDGLNKVIKDAGVADVNLETISVDVIKAIADIPTADVKDSKLKETVDKLNKKSAGLGDTAIEVLKKVSTKIDTSKLSAEDRQRFEAVLNNLK